VGIIDVASNTADQPALLAPATNTVRPFFVAIPVKRLNTLSASSRRAAAPNDCGNRVNAEVSSLIIAGAEIEAFQTKRLRSGVETLLARLKVPKEIRGHLQSHGISGVQARYYDGHDYIDEKRAALMLLFNTLESPVVSNVVPLMAAA
jgi:hypothetical protein